MKERWKKANSYTFPERGLNVTCGFTDRWAKRKWRERIPVGINDNECVYQNSGSPVDWNSTCGRACNPSSVTTPQLPGGHLRRRTPEAVDKHYYHGGHSAAATAARTNFWPSPGAKMPTSTSNNEVVFGGGDPVSKMILIFSSVSIRAAKDCVIRVACRRNPVNDDK